MVSRKHASGKHAPSTTHGRSRTAPSARMATSGTLMIDLDVGAGSGEVCRAADADLVAGTCRRW
jgi:hypothetical protein